MIPYTKTPKSISLTLNFVPKLVPKTHPNFDKIVELVKDPNTVDADIYPLLELPKPTNTFSPTGNVVIKGDKLFFKGFEINNSLSKVILEHVKAGEFEAARPFELFLENAFENPDRRAVTDLFDWVVHTGLPISPDGFILAWKAVRDDYYSIHGNGHSGTPRDTRFDHHIGNTVSEDRSVCDANPDVTCSSGLHFAAPSYLPSYASGGSRIVALKINPRDVVAFPRDYGWAKGRASEYVVVGEVPLDEVPTFYPQAKPIYKGWSAAASTLRSAPTTPRTAEGFAVGQLWADDLGRRHTIITTKSDVAGYPIQTDFGRFTATGKYVSNDEDNVRDLKRLIQDVA